MTYSLDFRIKVLETREKEKLSMAAVAKRFGIGINTVLLWTKRIEPIQNRNKAATKINIEALKQDIELYPDAYHYERAARLGVSKNGIWHALRRLKVSYKKNAQASQSRRREKISIS